MNETNGHIAKPLFVNDGTRYFRLNIDEIFYVGVEDHYCHVYAVNGKRMVTLSSSLDATLDAMNLDGRFVKISRYEFVNILCIREVMGNIITLTDGIRLNIGKTFRGCLEPHFCILNSKRV